MTRSRADRPFWQSTKELLHESPNARSEAFSSPVRSFNSAPLT